MKKGVTLAELLLTITIVGVISSYTIPSLLQNIQDAHLRTAWKKSYSELSRAITLIMSDNGGVIIGAYSGSNDSQRADSLVNLLKNKMNYARVCSVGTADGNCWTKLGDWKWANGDTSVWWPSDSAGFVLADGSFVVFHHMFTADCSDGAYHITCAPVMLDVNGSKGPNMLGKDIYYAMLTTKGLVPYGSPAIAEDQNNCTNPGDGGQGCGKLVLMNKDYKVPNK